MEFFDKYEVSVMQLLNFVCINFTYRMAGNFREVLIFTVFMVDLAVLKITTHEN